MGELQSTERIRVLLIDDNPPWAMRAVSRLRDRLPETVVSTLSTTELHATEIPAISVEDDRVFERCFDLRWLDSAEAAKEFRDLSSLLARTHPEELLTTGWVPEIVCFDYALTGFNPSARVIPESLRPFVSPLPRLRERVLELGLETLPEIPIPSSGAKPNDDNLGCFAGGLILSTFADHPVAAVATTRKGPETLKDTEAAVFEWFLNWEFFGTFDRKGRPKPDWKLLLSEGAANLRARIQNMVRARAIRTSIEDLLALSDSEEIDGLTLRIYSRYGLRHLPVPGLFVDHPPETRATEANAWARVVLRELFSITDGRDPLVNLSAFREGRQVTDALWHAYTSDLVDDRYRLSELARDESKLNDTDRDELERLRKQFEVTDSGRCRRHVVELRSFDCSDAAKRWAVLFMIVRLEATAAAARRKWELWCHELEFVSAPRHTFASVQQADVWLALFPIPSTPVTIRDPYTTFSVILKRLKADESSEIPPSLNGKWGNLTVLPADVLEGKQWFESNSVPDDHWTYGLRRGERHILQMYAEDIGLPDSDWPDWLRGG
jgi:hypothetical protein